MYLPYLKIKLRCMALFDHYLWCKNDTHTAMHIESAIDDIFFKPNCRPPKSYSDTFSVPSMDIFVKNDCFFYRWICLKFIPDNKNLCNDKCFADKKTVQFCIYIFQIKPCGWCPPKPEISKTEHYDTINRAEAKVMLSFRNRIK